jgi:hypothetical protein
VIRLDEEGEKNSKAIGAELEVGIKLGSTSKFLVQLTEFFIKNKLKSYSSLHNTKYK